MLPAKPVPFIEAREEPVGGCDQMQPHDAAFLHVRLATFQQRGSNTAALIPQLSLVLALSFCNYIRALNVIVIS